MVMMSAGATRPREHERCLSVSGWLLGRQLVRPIGRLELVARDVASADRPRSADAVRRR